MVVKIIVAEYTIHMYICRNTYILVYDLSLSHSSFSLEIPLASLSDILVDFYVEEYDDD